MRLLKHIARTLGHLRAMPVWCRYRAMSCLIGDARAFSDASEVVSRWPGMLGVYGRAAFYGRAIKSCGLDVSIGLGTLLSKPQATIGDRAYIGRHCCIGWAEIGEDVMIADGVHIPSGQHQHGRTYDGVTLRDQQQSFTSVKIGRGAWIGSGAIVMADIGENAIVAAGAVVTRPVACGTRVAGVPRGSWMNQRGGRRNHGPGTNQHHLAARPTRWDQHPA